MPIMSTALGPGTLGINNPLYLLGQYRCSRLRDDFSVKAARLQTKTFKMLSMTP